MSESSIVILITSACLNLIFFVALFFLTKDLFSIKSQLSDVKDKLISKEKTEKDQEGRVTALKNQVEAIKSTDSVTGLATKQVLLERIKFMVTESKRYDLIFAVLFMNLNEFKVLQNAIGDEAADGVLKKTAERLKDVLRNLDLVARFQEDDFVILLPQLAKAETAAYVAKRIINAMEKPFLINDQEVFVAASLGVSLYPIDADNDSLLLKNAELALHQAKASGCSIYQFYKKEMQIKSDRNLLIRSDLQKPRVENQFVLYYQPIININEKRIDGMQVLLYWKHETLGLLSFNDFLQQAEETGAIDSIGKWVLRNACQQLYQWRLDGFKFLSVSIPISIRQLENPHFVYNSSQILKEFHVELSSIIFEVSEKGLKINSDLSEKSLLMLNEMGVQTCVSDFGTGNMVLWKLKDFHVESLKIASDVVRNIAISKDMVYVVQMINSLAATLGLRLFASGVNYKKQAEKLSELGCNLMQGDLFNPPIEAKYFTKELEKDILNFQFS